MALAVRSDIDGVALSTLNRPGKLNAITRAMLVVLREHLDLLARDERIRCVVPSGAGPLLRGRS